MLSAKTDVILDKLPKEDNIKEVELIENLYTFIKKGKDDNKLYILPKNTRWVDKYYPYIEVENTKKPNTFSQVHDIIVSFEDEEKNQDYYVLKNPNYQKSWSLSESYKSLINKFRGYNKTYEFTINENPTTISKLFLDLDFSKGTFDDTTKKQWINNIIDFVKNYTNAEHTLYYNRYNGNYHIIWNVYDSIQNIKGMHILIQDYISLTEKNVKSVIDNSDGIRTILTVKQVKIDQRYDFPNINDYYIPSNQDIDLFNLSNDELASLITEHSIYNLNNIPKMDYHIDIWAASKRGTLQELNQDDLVKIQIYESTILKARFNVPFDEYLIQRGYKRREFTNIKDSLTDFDYTDDEYQGSYKKKIDLFGYIFKPEVGLYRDLLNILPSDFLLTRKNWFWLAYITKGFSIGVEESISDEIFRLFQAKSKEVGDKYEDRWTNNNRSIFDNLSKVNSNFADLIHLCFKYSLKRTLDALEINKFDYFKWKAINNYYKLDNRFKVNRYNGHTKVFNNKKGLEIIQANMGMGKTTRLEEYLNDESNKDKTILIITTKRTLGDSFRRRFPNFEHYDDFTGYINKPRVIVQMESLKRVNAWYDVIIMDEVHELLNQFISPYHNINETYLRFIPLIQHAEVVKMMDAFITPLVMTFVDLYFDDYTYNQNTKSRSKITYTFNETDSLLINKFKKALEDGKKIVFCCNSKKVLKDMVVLSKRYTDKILAVYADSDDNLKREITMDEETKIKEVQVFLYTPTITVGVDIQTEFDVVFGYFKNKCNDANSCIQMLNRVRNIEEKRIELFVMQNLEYQPEITDQDILEKRNSSKVRFNLIQNAINNVTISEPLVCETNKRGMVFRVENKPFNTLLKAIINNKVNSLNEFTGLFIHYIKMAGGRVKYDDEKTNPALKEEIRDERIQDDHQIFINTKLIESSDYDDLQSLLLKTKEDKEQIHKYRLHSIYGDLNLDQVPLDKYDSNAKHYLALSSKNKSSSMCVDSTKSVLKKDPYIQWNTGYMILQDLMINNSGEYQKKRDLTLSIGSFDLFKFKWNKETLWNTMNAKYSSKWSEMNKRFDTRTKAQWNEKNICNWINRMISLFKIQLITIANSKNGTDNKTNRTIYVLEYTDDHMADIMTLHQPNPILSFDKYNSSLDQDKIKSNEIKEDLITILQNHIITNPDIYKTNSINEVRYDVLENLIKDDSDKLNELYKDKGYIRHKKSKKIDLIESLIQPFPFEILKTVLYIHEYCISKEYYIDSFRQNIDRTEEYKLDLIIDELNKSINKK